MNITFASTHQDGHELINSFFSDFDNKFHHQTYNDDHGVKSKELMLEGACQCLTKRRVLVLAPSHLEPIEELSKNI